MARHFGLRSVLMVSITVLVVATGASIAELTYERTKGLLTQHALDHASTVAEAATRTFDSSLGPARSAIRLLALSYRGEPLNVETFEHYLESMAAVLKSSPAIDSVYLADRLGSELYLRKREGGNAMIAGSAGYIAWIIQRDALRSSAQTALYDDRLQLMSRKPDMDLADFDPRERPWFQDALLKKKLIRTRPYPFFPSGDIGSTLAIASEDGRAVVGIDLLHHQMDEVLKRYRLTKSTAFALYNADGQVLASDRREVFAGDIQRSPQISALSNPALAALATLPADSAFTPLGVTRGKVRLDGQLWHLERRRLQVDSTEPLYLGMTAPDQELLANANRLRDDVLLQTLIILALTLPFAFWLSGYLVAPISQLTRNARNMGDFNFSVWPVARSRIREVNELGAALEQNRSTQERFLELITQLSQEADFVRMLPTLLRTICSASQVNGALLCIRPEPGQPLNVVAGRWEETELDAAKLGDAIMRFSLEEALLVGVCQSRKPDPQACAALDLPPAATLSVPLFTRSDHEVGVLLLFNRQALSADQIRFVEVISGIVAVALEARGLIDRQAALFESFIQLIAGAIDAKSPYTGGHCSRVPDIAKMIAEATCAETQGPYARFHMSESDHRALHLAAWLHDCGKVTTPEYVVDKATKLESLYDRIHEVRTRFEVLKRDAEIEYLQACLAGADKQSAREIKNSQWQRLDDEFAFIARCNTGREFMDEEGLQKLHAIASRTWLRTLDDRLGISGEERVRKEAQPVQSLPCIENLLVDRPEHRIARNPQENLDPQGIWGFNMKVPELLYDHGEVKNLSIQRGTLTAEERYKINEHIVQTIVMLNALPFPPELSQVPQIAGGHHERIDGKGYPRGLSGDQLLPQTRMMALADVFEALTARDRPYKPSKTLSQALQIMREMCENGHLDAELFNVFLRSGACLRYAYAHLHSDQLDITCTDVYCCTPS
jgi:HD-GYP domain-containing protein (c-di-GMP phosphodiesterase class II)